MSVLIEQTVGQLVAENPDRARVFEKHRIDYCCGGKIPLSEACERRKVNLDEVVKELAQVDASSNGSERDWTVAPLAELCDNIVNTHHAFLRDELPRLEGLAARVAKVHGDRAPYMVELHEIFLTFRQELEQHAMKEEQVLFPWIKKMEADGAQSAPFGASVENPIRCMEHEHDDAGAALDKFRELTSDYTPPEDACNTWQVLYSSLDALERDMYTHVHKENSILFPRALDLERQLTS